MKKQENPSDSNPKHPGEYSWMFFYGDKM